AGEEPTAVHGQRAEADSVDAPHQRPCILRHCFEGAPVCRAEKSRRRELRVYHARAHARDVKGIRSVPTGEERHATVANITWHHPVGRSRYGNVEGRLVHSLPAILSRRVAPNLPTERKVIWSLRTLDVDVEPGWITLQEGHGAVKREILE